MNVMPPEERFSRTLFGIIMVGAFFVPWGKWPVMILGALFLISAWWGCRCVMCEVYRWVKGKKEESKE